MNAQIKVPYPQTDDLPAWMRRALRQTDWGALLIIAFSFIAAWTFIVQIGLPSSLDGENYLFRIADYAQTMREGVLYPRWSAHVLGGYGAPVAHFYPPLPTHLPALFSVFLTNDPILAVRIFIVISFFLAGGATYSFVARRSDASAGLLASTLYIFSPVVASITPIIIGDIPLIFLHALLPILLWSVDGILLLNRVRDRLITTLAFSGLILTDIRFAFAALILMVLLMAWHVYQSRSYRRPAIVMIALALGVGIAAFYWYVVLVEWDQVSWHYLGVQNPQNLIFSKLFSPYLPVDPLELMPTPQFTAGIMIAIFSGIGAAYLLFERKGATFQTFWLFIAVGVCISAYVFLPSQTWLLSIITFSLAIFGSITLAWREKLPPNVRYVVLPVSLISVLVGTTSIWLVQPVRIYTLDLTPAAQIEYEQQQYGIAILPSNAPIPIPNIVSELAAPNPALVNGYRTNDINRVMPQSGVQIGTLTNNSHNYNLQISAIAPTELDVLTTYYQGWRVGGNAIAASIAPNPTTGLIDLMIEGRGAGEVDLKFDGTPQQTTAWALTWLSFSGLLLLGYARGNGAKDHSQPEIEFPLLSIEETRLTTLIVIGFICVIALIATPFSPMQASARGGYKLDNALAMRTRTDVGIETLGYYIPRAEYRAGESIDFTIYWRTLRFLDQNYLTYASLTSRATGTRWQSVPMRHIANHPTRRWATNLYIADEYTIPLLNNLPAGEYTLSIELYNCLTNCDLSQRLSFFDSRGQALGNQFSLPVVITIAP